MKILFCGKFDPDYNRTRVIIEGLRKMGTEISIYSYPRKRKADKKVLKKMILSADLVFMPSFTHTDVPFIRKMTDKPILFDPLISRYLSKVFDYKAVSKNSPRALKNFLKDSRSLSRADMIISDTLAHKKYFVEKFRIPPEKIRVVPIGVIRNDFFPVNVKRKIGSRLVVGFYGSFIPLHGIDVILRAANKLKHENNIVFRFIGDGILMKNMVAYAEKMQLENVEFLGWKKYEDLNEEINKFDICLGIFGNSIKAKMVVPNKLFHYSACGKPVISMKSDALNEVFTHDKNILATRNNPQDLAEAIQKLKEPQFRKRLGENAQKLVNEEYTEEKIGSLIMDFINDRI